MDRATIERDLEIIRQDLHALASRVGDSSSYCAEIEDALERVIAIEAHLAVGRKVAA